MKHGFRMIEQGDDQLAGATAPDRGGTIGAGRGHQRPVRAERPMVHLVSMCETRPQPAAGNVPQLTRAISTGREHLAAVGAECAVEDGLLVLQGKPRFGSSRGVPDSRRTRF